jgi:2-dehydro-3-deoxy-L-rhamnonate dehydrogenase (NAD+)
MGFLTLDGQTAVITGGASGIGLAIARRLAEAGARTGIADVNLEGARTAAAAIPGAFALALDLRKPESIREAFATLDRVDILVNNAGIAGPVAPVEQYPLERWQEVFDINLTGAMLCCQAVLGGMRARRYGRIVNVASIAGKEGNPNMCAYSASKAGLIGLTKSLGKEVATEGICVNAVAPAVVRTPILEQLTPAQVAYMVERIPMKRTGEPEEVAAVVHFLASPECSFVTGQCYDCSGGRAVY